MDLQLMRLRKLAGYRNRDDFAARIGVNKHTYRSWETGGAMMSFEQAIMCAEALGCTTDELAGLNPPETTYTDPRQDELNRCWDACDEVGKAHILESARGASLLHGHGGGSLDYGRAEAG